MSFCCNCSNNSSFNNQIHCTSCYLTIFSPQPNETLSTLETIEGFTQPNASVDIVIDDNPPMTVVADSKGHFEIDNPYYLSNGNHSLWASTDEGRCRTYGTFNTTGSPCGHMSITPVEARMGATFRTIDIDVLTDGAFGPAEMYYLLLPPGSAVPTESQIKNYTDTSKLIDGTAATGRFPVMFFRNQSLYTFSLSGLDNPNAPAGTTGVVDGYRYDVYIVIAFGSDCSFVNYFSDNAVLGMPFAAGKGSEDSPFIIENLSPSELAKYPDLLQDSPMNKTGVDENARQLENIERLITLYEDTDGLYGLETSMELHYALASDISLDAYADAYDGEGWQPIGDIDGWINDKKQNEHIFSGTFNGNEHTISDMSINVKATADNFVGYRGLFGAVEDGTIENLFLEKFSINAFATTPGNSYFGSLISIAKGATLRNLKLSYATIVADSDTPSIGDTHVVNAGGFVGELSYGVEASDILGDNITILVPQEHALALGGFAGLTNRKTGYDSFDNVNLSSVSISGYAMIGGLAGYMVYGEDTVSDVTVKDCFFTAPGGLCGGIGGLYLQEPDTFQQIEKCVVSQVYMSSGSSEGDCIGGIFGRVENNPYPDYSQVLTGFDTAEIDFSRPTANAKSVASPGFSLSQSSVTGGRISCGNYCGGLIGFINLGVEELPTVMASGQADNVISLCKTDLSILATKTAAGGLIGHGENCTISQSFAKGTAAATVNLCGALFGTANNVIMDDCYATGDIACGNTVGGIAGSALYSTFNRGYRTGNVQGSISGGFVGSILQSTVNGGFVLSGVISGYPAHRFYGILSFDNSYINNYAVDRVVPDPGPNPDEFEGVTISQSEVPGKMASSGFAAPVWDMTSIPSLGRPTLINNPED